MIRRIERAPALTAWTIAIALVASPLAASICGDEPTDEKTMECCKDMVHCNTPVMKETCCNPEGSNQTGDASATVAVTAKQKSQTDSAVLSSQPTVSASVACLSRNTLTTEPSTPLPRHPLIKPLRI
ncbi:MAG: hypothetical protein ACRD21_04710 [Vicinamibacteria bacterium]